MLTGIGSQDGFSGFEETNKFIDFVLRSCLSLVKFEIDGMFDEVEENSVLRFDFSHLKHLKSFSIDINAPNYYKLNVPGKENDRWVTLDTRYEKKKTIEGNNLVVEDAEMENRLNRCK